MNKKNVRKNCTLPPWLWFWLIIYIFSFPAQVRNWKWYLRYLFSSFDLLKLGSIPELIPSLALFFGVITIFFPRLRSIWLERKFKLNEVDSVSPKLPERTRQVVLEIEGFLKSHTPDLQIKVNFHRFDQNSFLYNSGYNKTSIALFGGILWLWKSERKVAEAVLLHEMGHYRNGDASVIGAGSFFEWVLRYCLTITVLFFLIPFILVMAGQTITFFNEGFHEELVFLDIMKDVGMSTTEMIFHFLNFSFSIIIFKLKNLLLVTLPGMLFIILGLLFLTINTFILPIIGIWCAELNADRFMAESSDSPSAQTKALDRISEKVPLIHWLLSQVSHPPRWFRKWMVSDTKKVESKVVFLLLFPLAYFLKLAGLLVWGFVNYMVGYAGGINKFSDILEKLAINTETYLKTVSVVWLLSTVLILLWPIIAVYWIRLFSGEIELSNWENYKQYVLSAGIVFCLFVAGYLI